jgi:hypothetical protein
MKTLTHVVAAGVGYLAGNENARAKAIEFARWVRATAPAQSVEARVTREVTSLAGGRPIDTPPVEATANGEPSNSTGTARAAGERWTPVAR